MTILSERFSEAMDTLNMKNADIAKKYTISRQLVNNFFTKQKTITDVMAIVCDGENININWLLTGNGNMFINKEIISNKHNTYNIDILSLKASAGTGIINYEEETIGNMSVDTGFFPSLQKTENLRIIEVVGDSMEPTIKNGARVVIDISKKYKANGIYAINYDGEIYIKRLQYRMDGVINIISDNTIYPIETYNGKESDLYFDIIGMKVLTIQE